MLRRRIVKTFVGLVSLSLGILWLYAYVLGLDLPKTLILRRQNAAWTTRLQQADKELDQLQAKLEGLSLRDDGVYRNVFGMNSVGKQKRYSGFGGLNRYDRLDQSGASPLLSRVVRKIDLLTKAACVQSQSFDDVSTISRRAGDIASCLPVVIPMDPGGKFHTSSPFGLRKDPIRGTTKFHAGIDFAMPPGSGIYCTGDGTVEKVYFSVRGYGRSVLVNHGFGYKTRYAHLKTIDVTEGMKLSRGDRIGTSGNTGKSTGPHLHYEVLYRGKAVNPLNYFDFGIESEDYQNMVQQAQERSDAITPDKLPKRF